MMKSKKIYSFIVCTCFIFNLYGQDVIVTIDGNSILSKIIDFSNNKIKYKSWTNQDGPIYIITSEKISFIEYQNGEKVVFNNSKNKRLDKNKEIENKIWGSNYNVNDAIELITIMK